MTRAHANGVWFAAVPAAQRCDYYGDEEINETDECKGCAFDRKKSDACRAAGAAAAAVGLPDCESRPDLGKPGFIYRLDKTRKL